LDFHSLFYSPLQPLFNSQISTLGLSLGAMFLVLFRSFKIAFLALTVNMVPISVIFGIMGIAGIPLDMMSITIASIALGTTVDNTIHYLYRCDDCRLFGIGNLQFYSNAYLWSFNGYCFTCCHCFRSSFFSTSRSVL